MRKLAGFLGRVILGAVIFALIIGVIAGIIWNDTLRIVLVGLIGLAFLWMFGDVSIMAWKDIKEEKRWRSKASDTRLKERI